jgi:hypothetical protein
MTAQQERKQALRAFMQMHYTDEKLAALLAHARDGKLMYWSCCCFIGLHNAPHAYASSMLSGESQHFSIAYSLKGGEEANTAYAQLSKNDSDTERRRILIPIIRAEMWRREYARRQAVSPVEKVPEIPELVGRG